MSQKGNEPAAASEESASKESELRAYLGRILGWSEECTQAIEHARRSITLSVIQRAALVLVGRADLVPIAHALHRHSLGADRPFVLCNPRRSEVSETPHLPRSYASGEAALRAAHGGSLCLLRRRLPVDFLALVTMARDPTAAVQIIVCSDLPHSRHPYLILPVPIRVPALKTRARELPRIVDEYAGDALAALGADAACFTGHDRRWVLDHAAGTLREIETTTLRIVAMRQTSSVTRAAKRLKISPVSMSYWFRRRGWRLEPPRGGR